MMMTARRAAAAGALGTALAVGVAGPASAYSGVTAVFTFKAFVPTTHPQVKGTETVTLYNPNGTLDKNIALIFAIGPGALDVALSSPTSFTAVKGAKYQVLILTSGLYEWTTITAG